MNTAKGVLINKIKAKTFLKIYIIRGKKVIIDRDLARLYNVPVNRLNQQVKRNIRRFPDDFMFQLDQNEWASAIKSDVGINTCASPVQPARSSRCGQSVG